MAGVSRTGFLPYPGEKLSPDDPARDPDIWNVFLKDLEAAPGRFWKSLIGDPGTALNVLGDAITTPNSVPVTEDDFIKQMLQKGEFNQAADILGGLVNVSGAGAASTMRPEEELLNIFAGPRSQTADRDALNDALEAAKNMKEVNSSKGISGLTGNDIQDIFSSTGWFPGVDGKWRYEIPDTVRARAGMPNPDAMFESYVARAREAYPKASHTIQDYWNTAKYNIDPLTRLGVLSQFIDHPELFDAYPEIKNLSTKVTGAPGFAPSGENSMTGSINATAGTQADLVSVLLHEIQHEVQLQEGFVNGGNPEAMGQYLAQLEPSAMGQLNFPKPYDLYQALMGEVEARQVQSRYELGYADPRTTNDPRLDGIAPVLDTDPALGMDIPREWQLDPKWFIAPSSQPEIQNIPPGEYYRRTQSGENMSHVAEEVLKEKLRAYAAKLRDDTASNFMKAASK